MGRAIVRCALSGFPQNTVAIRNARQLVGYVQVEHDLRVRERFRFYSCGMHLRYASGNRPG